MIWCKEKIKKKLHVSKVLMVFVVMLCLSLFTTALGGNGRALAEPPLLSGVIKGVVTDTSGNVLPDTRVKIKEVATNLVSDAITDANGCYSKIGLKSGEYIVTTYDTEEWLPAEAQTVTLSYYQPIKTADLKLRSKANITGTVSGTVLDLEGNVITDRAIVSVSISVNGKWQSWESPLDKEGRYSIGGLPFGNCNVHCILYPGEGEEVYAMAGAHTWQFPFFNAGEPDLKVDFKAVRVPRIIVSTSVGKALVGDKLGVDLQAGCDHIQPGTNLQLSPTITINDIKNVVEYIESTPKKELPVLKITNGVPSWKTTTLHYDMRVLQEGTHIMAGGLYCHYTYETGSASYSGGASFQISANIGKISGSVKDQYGEPLGDYKVVLRNTATNDTRSAKTSKSGEYLFDYVTTGNYRVEASVPDGFYLKPESVNEVSLDHDNPTAIVNLFIVGVPGDFNLLKPGNGADMVSRTPTLEWEVSAGAESYDVYFGKVLPENPIATVTGTSLAITEKLEYNTEYIWQVIAKNPVGEKLAANAPFRFHTGVISGIIKGQVTDSQGEPMAGVKVIITKMHDESVTTVLTDKDGNYSKGGFGIGAYQISAIDPEGYMPHGLTENMVTISLNNRLRVADLCFIKMPKLVFKPKYKGSYLGGDTASIKFDVSLENLPPNGNMTVKDIRIVITPPAGGLLRSETGKYTLDLPSLKIDEGVPSWMEQTAEITFLIGSVKELKDIKFSYVGQYAVENSDALKLTLQNKGAANIKFAQSSDDEYYYIRGTLLKKDMESGEIVGPFEHAALTLKPSYGNVTYSCLTDKDGNFNDVWPIDGVLDPDTDYIAVAYDAYGSVAYPSQSKSTGAQELAFSVKNGSITGQVIFGNGKSKGNGVADAALEIVPVAGGKTIIVRTDVNGTFNTAGMAENLKTGSYKVILQLPATQVTGGVEREVSINYDNPIGRCDFEVVTSVNIKELKITDVKVVDLYGNSEISGFEQGVVYARVFFKSNLFLPEETGIILSISGDSIAAPAMVQKAAFGGKHVGVNGLTLTVPDILAPDCVQSINCTIFINKGVPEGEEITASVESFVIEGKNVPVSGGSLKISIVAPDII